MTIEEEVKKDEKHFHWSYNLTYVEQEVKGLPAKEVIILTRDGIEITVHCDYVSLDETTQILFFYFEGRICSIVPISNILYTTSKTARGE